MPRDIEIWPHISDAKCRALAIRGHNETIAELIAAGKERALAAIDDALDACDEIETEAPGSMTWAKAYLADARSEVGGE